MPVVTVCNNISGPVAAVISVVMVVASSLPSSSLAIRALILLNWLLQVAALIFKLLTVTNVLSSDVPHRATGSIIYIYNKVLKRKDLSAQSLIKIFR